MSNEFGITGLSVMASNAGIFKRRQKTRRSRAPSIEAAISPVYVVYVDDLDLENSDTLNTVLSGYSDTL